MSLSEVPVIDAVRIVELLDWRTAIDGLVDFMSAPQTSVAPRSAFGCRSGELLLMPAESQSYVGVKVISLNHEPPTGVPRAQGVYTLFDAGSLSPVALLDAVELTLIRTAAVSALAIDRLAAATSKQLVVFGTGPQSIAHAQAIAAIRDLERIVIVGRRRAATERVCASLAGDGLPAVVGDLNDIATADIVACCTAAARPLFDSHQLQASAAVVAMGSHHPDRREVDTELVRTSFVVVESRCSALREAGDIVLAHDDPDTLIDATLAELVGGIVTPTPGRRFFKSVGEAWQDLALASLAFELNRQRT